MRCAGLLVALAACTVGAPPGFSAGDTWTFPLVDALDTGRLLTPVYVDGRGPFLFAIDPNSSKTVVDPQVGFLQHVQIGTLTISSVRAWGRDHTHEFDTHGHLVYGALGRDVIADSLVFGFDRDRSIAWLQTRDSFHRPASAIELPANGDWISPSTDVRAHINGIDVALEVDLGRATSTLQPDLWRTAHLQEVSSHLEGLPHAWSWERTQIATVGAAPVAVTGVATKVLQFAPSRFGPESGDGADGGLALDFFAPYVVEFDRTGRHLYVTPRRTTSVERSVRQLRWGEALPAACASRGCLQVDLQLRGGVLYALAERTAADPSTPLEVVLAAVAQDGHALPNLYASLPAGVMRVEAEVHARYLGSTLAVVDVSPFPMACSSGCVLPSDDDRLRSL